MIYSDDPVADYAAWDAEQYRRTKNLPICADCNDHITSEFAYYINGEWICEDCMSAYMREVPQE